MRRGRREHYLAHREYARAVVLERLAFYNRLYGYRWGRVSIRNTRTRWGSCSRAGNLNFSYQVALLPEELRDYVIIHELCHLAQLNHSSAFWTLVARAAPEHRAHRRALRTR